MDRFITRTSTLIESSPSTSGTSKQSKDSPSTSGTLKMSGNSPSTARPSKQSKGKCRLYDESYISIGFTWCGPEDEPILMIRQLKNRTLKSMKILKTLPHTESGIRFS